MIHWRPVWPAGIAIVVVSDVKGFERPVLQILLPMRRNDVKVSTEEFFMYLTIALIVLVPMAARLYRYLTVKQMKRTLHEQFGKKELHEPTGSEKR
jgi:hypothetical protein